jgi:hypothetical protein
VTWTVNITTTKPPYYHHPGIRQTPTPPSQTDITPDNNPYRILKRRFADGASHIFSTRLAPECNTHQLLFTQLTLRHANNQQQQQPFSAKSPSKRYKNMQQTCNNHFQTKIG